MIRYRYSQLRLTTKLIFGVGLLLLATLTTWTFHYNTLLVAVVTASALAAIHIALTFWKSTLSAFVILIQLAIYFTLGDGTALYLGGHNESLNLNVTVTRVLLLLLAIIQAALFGYISYRFAKGRMWFNLAVSFLLFNIVGFLLFIFFIKFAGLAIIAGFVAGLGYLTFRSLRKRKNDQPPVKPVLNKSLRQNIENSLTDMKLKFINVSNDINWEATHYIAHDEHAIYNIRVVAAKEPVTMNSRGFTVEGESANPAFEFLRLDAMDNKTIIPAKETISVFLLTSESLLPQGTKTVTISRRKQPNYSLGVVLVATPQRLKKFVVAQRLTKKLPGKMLKKLDF